MSVNLFKKRSASALFAAAFMVSGVASAANLNSVQSEENKIHKDAVKSQQTIDKVYDESRELLADYRTIVDEIENLKVYNDHVARLVADQNEGIASLERQIGQIENTKQGVVPLMYNMIDTLEKFIELDVPINMDDRKERVERLRRTMGRSDVTTSEKYRQVLEAYQIESDYGSMLQAYEGRLPWDGKEINVDFFHLGRIVFLAQSQDLKNAWRWDNQARKWEKLSDEFVRPVTQAIRMARKQTAPDLIKLPVPAAE